MMPPSDLPTPGQTISHYEILELLGQGAMGSVFKAKDLRLRRFVALKVMNREMVGSDQGAKRLISEAQAAAALEHPNICPVYEIDEYQGCPFIVMAYIPGSNLLKKMSSQLMKVDEAFRVTRQIALGLQAAHEKGVVHRDIKPANVLVADDGVVKIADFGLAKMQDMTRITRAGGTVGTLPYTSPEQIRGEDVDGRADLWSVGVVLYQMLTGVLPFRGDNSLALMNAILTHSPDPVSEFRPAVPVRTDQMMFTLLEKHAEHRYQTALELIAELDEIGGITKSDYGVVVDAGKASSVRSSSAAQRRRLPSIAVLPFVNLSSDQENEYFSDGLTEELITALARSEGLRVVSRTSAFEFKGKSENVRRIGEKLNVDSVIEGSVRRIGDQLRITVQIINVHDGYPTWSEKFDREMRDVFALQDEIALRVANAFKVNIGAEPRTPIAGSAESAILEAYHQYLRGRYCWNQQTPESLQKAIGHFEQALKLDPQYGAAYAGLADYYCLLGVWSLAPPEAVWAQTKNAALRALELDDSLAEAHISLGYFEIFYGWNRQAAEREFLRAIELNGGLSLAHYSYSVYLVVAGRLDEAAKEMRHARILDPLSLLINSGLGLIYYYARQYDQAIEEHQKTLEIDPNYAYSNLGLGLAYQQMERYPDAILYLEKACALTQRTPLPVAFLGACYAQAGQREKALSLIDELTEAAASRYVSPVCWAVIYAALGDADHAFEWLEKSAQSRAAVLVYLPVLPVFDSLRSDPRYADLLQTLDRVLEEEPTRIRP